MEKVLISEGREYAIPCVYSIKGDEKQVCVVIHGFSSHKESPTAKMMVERLPDIGIGAIAFDLPAHGESEVDGRSLRISNCLNDIMAVTDKARALAPNAEIVYFASSFGAYLVLIYLAGLAKAKKTTHRAFLRAAAVSMPMVVHEGLTPEQKMRLNDAGEFVLTEEEGYSPELIITKEFLADLENNDVFHIWHKGIADLHMIHGEADEVIYFSDAEAFAKTFDITLTSIPQGDHQISEAGMPELVFETAEKFFK